MKKEIIVSKNNINKAVKDINSLKDEEYFELEKEFVNEQPIIQLYISDFVKVNELSDDIINEIASFAMIIWQSFKNECSELPIIPEEIIDRIDEESYNNDIELENSLGFTEDELSSKMEKLNKKIAKKSISNPKEFLKLLEEEGLQNFLPTLLNNFSNMPQQYIDEYIFSEIIDMEDDYEQNELANMESILRVIIKSFDTVINHKPIMQVVKSEKKKTGIKKSNPKVKNAYQVKISLDGIKPPIWRRVLVEDDISLDEFHEIILSTMGWDGYHLYDFRIGNLSYQVPHEDDFGMGDADSEQTLLSDIVYKEKQQFKYTYDFGDNWQHTIIIEKILPFDNNQDHPVCIKGKRNCPPEDCGGIWGYQEFLKAINDKNHPEHKEQLEWAGGEFDPEEFDLDEINSFLF